MDDCHRTISAQLQSGRVEGDSIASCRAIVALRRMSLVA